MFEEEDEDEEVERLSWVVVGFGFVFGIIIGVIIGYILRNFVRRRY